MARVFFHYFVICVLLCYVAIYGFAGLAMANTVLFHGDSASPNKLAVSAIAALCGFLAVFFACTLRYVLKLMKGN